MTRKQGTRGTTLNPAERLPRRCSARVEAAMLCMFRNRGVKVTTQSNKDLEISFRVWLSWERSKIQKAESTASLAKKAWRLDMQKKSVPGKFSLDFDL